MASDEDEVAATENVLQRLQNARANGQRADFHVVSAILQRNHCEPNAVTCRHVNRGENYIKLLESGVRGWFIESGPDFNALGGT